MLESLLFFSTISLIKLSILAERVFSFHSALGLCAVWRVRHGLSKPLQSRAALES